MVNTYTLINPHIEGQFNTKIKAKNSQEAASLFYTELGGHINNSLPQFYFSIQKGSSGEGSLYSFKVKEEKLDNQVNFSLEPVTIKNDELSNFKKKLEEFKLTNSKLNGGKLKKHKSHKSHKSKSHKDKDSSDSSSDSSSSDEVYKKSSKYINNLNVPIYYWWYYPYLYDTSSIYIPTFYSYITPYIELSLY